MLVSLLEGLAGRCYLFFYFFDLSETKHCNPLKSHTIPEGCPILSAVITPIQLLILAASITTFLLRRLLINKTRMGKAMTAVADNPLGASVAGINPEKVILCAFAVG